MAEYLIRLATQADNEALCSLCELPMPGSISLAFPRRPAFFDSNAIQVSHPALYVLEHRQSKQVEGMFSVGSRAVYVNGQPKELPYFSDLRLHPNARGGRALFELCDFAAQQDWMQNSFGQTVVFADNATMLSLIQKLKQRGKRNKWFLYHEAGDLISWMISLRKKVNLKIPAGIELRKATIQDMPKLQLFWEKEASAIQFAPVYDFSKLGEPYYKGLEPSNYYLAFEKGELVACCGIWDQGNFRQTLVHSYAGALRYLRPFINLLSGFWGDIELPPAGKELAYLNVHTLAVTGRRPDLLLALIQAIRSDYSSSGYAYLLLGMDAFDPLQEAMKQIPNKRSIQGKHYLVSGQEQFQVPMKHPFYLEAARI